VEGRTWSTYNYTALWVAMSVNIPTYMLASGMIAGRMDWKKAIFTVILSKELVLVPMLLNAHAGANRVVGFWATVALNIPDFTRYPNSQRSQVLGQALDLHCRDQRSPKSISACKDSRQPGHDQPAFQREDQSCHSLFELV